MFRNLIILLIVITSFLSCEKNKVEDIKNTTDVSKVETKGELLYLKGKKHGLSKSWYSNGKKHTEINYINGKREGKTIFWFMNGHKKSLNHFKNGRLHGKFIKWKENGELLSEKTYENGLLK